MPQEVLIQDPRDDKAVKNLADELKRMNPDQLVARLRRVNNDDLLGWVRYHFPESAPWGKPWQVILINRWLERDKFFRNVLPQWLGTLFGILSFAVSVLALVVALRAPR